MATTTESVLIQRLSEDIGDYLPVIVTTAINADNLIISTHLRSYDLGRDDFFEGWWVYITDKANVGINRQISAYATATGQITVRGAVLSDDTANLATVRVSRYNHDDMLRAINNAIREIYPDLYTEVDDLTLATGNIIPDGHFEDWSSTTALSRYTVSAGDLARTSVGGLARGETGTYSAKYTAGGADDYFYISSDSYPRLLDLMGQTVTFKGWAYPEVADDAFLVIYTLQADTTAQTLTSTTVCPAGHWTQLKLEDQVLNDNLVEIQLRWKIKTNAKYAYFDDARLTGRGMFEYLCPKPIVSGEIIYIGIQTKGYSDDPCDDLHPRYFDQVFGADTDVNDGTERYIRLPFQYTQSRRIRIQGSAPLETLAAATDTINLDGNKVNLLIAYAKYHLFKLLGGSVSSQDTKRYKQLMGEAYGEYMSLKHLRMVRKSRPLMLRNVY